MPQPGQQARLALEGFDHPLIVKKALLKRDMDAEIFIFRKIDRSHAAFADLADDMIATLNDRAWCKHREASGTWMSRRDGSREYSTRQAKRNHKCEIINKLMAVSGSHLLFIIRYFFYS